MLTGPLTAGGLAMGGVEPAPPNTGRMPSEAGVGLVSGGRLTVRCSCQRGGSIAAGLGSGAGVAFASRVDSFGSLALGASVSRALLLRAGLSESDLPLSATD